MDLLCQEAYNINLKVYVLNLYNKSNQIEKKLFVGKSTDCVKELKKMSNSNETNKDLEVVKDNYSSFDFELIKKHIKNSELVFDSIYSDDSYQIAHKKLQIIFGIKDTDNDIYLWIEKKNINTNILLDVINRMYESKPTISKNEIIVTCKNLFNKNIEVFLPTQDSIDKITLFNILSQKYDKLDIKLQIGFSYYGKKLETIYIEANPFKNLVEDPNFISASGEKQTIYSLKNYNKYLFELLALNCKEINLCKKSDLMKYVDTQNLTTTVKNSLNYKYFPIIRSKNTDDIKENLNIIDSRIEETQLNAKGNSESQIACLRIRLKPLYNNNTIDIENLFKNLETTKEVPFIVHHSKTNNYYKMSKLSLSDIYANESYTIEQSDFKKWTSRNTGNKDKPIDKDKPIERARESIIFKFYVNTYKNENKFITIILYDNNDINLFYNFKKHQKFTNDDLILSFDKINKFISSILKDMLIVYPILDKYIFDTMNSLIQLTDYHMYFSLNQVKKYNYVKLNHLINYMYPYFDEIVNKDKKEKNKIKFKYKRVNSSFTDEDVYKFLKSNLELTKENILKGLIVKFAISYDYAKDIYTVYKDSLEDINKFKKEYNLDTVIELNWVTNSVFIKNITSHSAFCRIVNLINTLYKLNEDNIDHSKVNNTKLKLDEDIVDNSSNNIDIDNSISNSSNTDSEQEDYGFYNEADFYVGDEENEQDQEEASVKNETAIEISEDEDQTYGSILKRLKESDPELFDFSPDKDKKFSTYSTQCQSNDKRQPIILSGAQKRYIDKFYPHSYLGYLSYDSRQEKTNPPPTDQYFICPKIWCPISKVSLNEEQLKLLEGKCPEGEPPLRMESTYFTKNNVQAERYPGFLNKGATTKHPKQLKLPCCFLKPQKTFTQDYLPKTTDIKESKKKTTKELTIKTEETIKAAADLDKLTAVEDKETTDKYILTSLTAVTQPNRYSILPPIISNLLQDEKHNQGKSIGKDTKSYVRKGSVEQSKDMFLSSAIMLLNNKNITTIKNLIDIIVSNLKPLEYILLNNGNTVKIYYNSMKVIYDKVEFKLFKSWFKNNKEYVDKFKLKKIINFIDNLDEFTISPNDKNLDLKKIIMREYIIYNSFTNFLNYLKSDIKKSHEEMLDLFSAKFKYINPHGYNFVIINEDENNSYLCCSKFYDIKYEVDLLKPFVFILKNNVIYEPITYIELNVGKIKELSQFYSYNDEKINKIVSLYTKNCNTVHLKNFINPRKLENIIKASINYKIKFLVITTTFKSVGFILNNNIFIPFNKLNNIYTTKYNFIYIQDIYELKVNITFIELSKIYEKLNMLLATKDTDSSLTNKIYNIHDQIIDENKHLLGLILEVKHLDKVIIPIDFNKNNLTDIYDKIKESKLNFNTFINYQESNEEKLYNKLYANKEDIVKKYLIIIAKNIISDPKLYREINHIKHPLNPFSNIEKNNLILDIITVISKKLNIVIDSDISSTISKELLYKDIFYIIKSSLAEMKLSHNEILFDQEDVEDKKLEKIIDSIDNPFKTINNSIEDSIEYVSIEAKQKIKNWKILTDNFEEKITPNTPWGLMMNKEFSINIPNEYNNLFILELFKKIDNLKSNAKMTVQIL